MKCTNFYNRTRPNPTQGMVTESECIESLKEAKKILGESPTKRQYKKLGLSPSASSIVDKFEWNEIKKKAELETYDDQPTVDVDSKPDDVDFSDEEWESLTAAQRSYYRHRQKRSSKKKNKKKERRRWFDELKRERYSCEVCGEGHPSCVEFHHDSPEEKVADISDMVPKYSKEKIFEEIEKCTVLCANCHRKRHYEKP